MFKLHLAIRLKEDHPIIYDQQNDILVCDKDCKYSDCEKHYCKFFHENLPESNEICAQCFLQEENT